MDSIKELAYNNMAVVASLVIALVLVLVYFFWRRTEKAKGKKNKMPTEEEVDELIEKIHSKQKKPVAK